MANDGGKQSRDAAAGFGTAAENGFGAIKDAFDSLNGKQGADEPRDDHGDGGDVNITVNR